MVTYWKSVLRSVRSSLSRFLAIFSIVALGVGFLAGLLSTTPDMRHSVGVLYQETALMDLRVVSTLGLTEADAAAVGQIHGVSAVMPSHTLDQEVLTTGGDTATARIHGVAADNWGGSAPDYLNRTTLVSGRWPETEQECVIEVNYQFGVDADLGGTLTLTDSSGDSGFRVQEFTIVGTVRSGYYLSRSQRGTTSVGNGQLSYIVYVDDRCFDLDYYTDLFVAVSGAETETVFSDSYDRYVDSVQEALETLGETQRLVRRDALREDALAVLEDARQTLAEQSALGEQQLADARAELESSAEQLANAHRELKTGEAAYQQGLLDLTQAKQAYETQAAQGNAALLEQEAALNAAPGRLTAAQAALDEQKAQLELTDRQLTDARAQLNQGKALLLSIRDLTDSIAALKQLTEVNAVTPTAFAPAQQAAGAFRAGFAAQAEEIRQIPATNRGAVQQLALDLYDLCGQLTAIDPAGDLNGALSPLLPAMGQLASERTQAEAALAAQEAALTENERRAAAARTALAQAQTEIDQGWADYAAGLPALEAGRQALEAGRAQAEAEFSAAQETLDASRKRLDRGWADYTAGRDALAEGQRLYTENEAVYQSELLKAQDEIQAGEDQVAAIEEPEWYVLDRRTNPAYVSYDSDTMKVEAIAQIFPVFFFLVAALVASTTMTRMVEEERGQIGLLKALGYDNSAIAGKFLSYAGAAALLGSGAGLAIGLSLFPKVIYNAYRLLYNLPPLQGATHWIYGLLSTVLILLAILLSTAAALRGSLRDCAAGLMRPKAPPVGKRIWLEYVRPVWRHLSFTYKVTARNLFRYKKRFLMTVIGVAGCTALLLAGFGLRNSIGEIVSKQFGEIQQYNLTIDLKHAEAVDTDPRIQSLLADPTQIRDHTAVHTETGAVVKDGEETSVYLVVPADVQALTEFVDFHHRTDDDPVVLGENTVILSEKAARVLDVSAGDAITLRDADGREATVTVGDIMENYVYGYLFLPQSVYTEAFGRSCDFSTLYAKTTGTDAAARDALATSLLASPNVASVQFSDAIIESFSDMLSSIDSIVIVLILSAGALALVVLYNLTNINITERQKELATLKVLGFYRTELSAYIFREGILLTLIGAAVGLGSGIFLHAFIVQTAEVDAVMFGRVIQPSSYFFAAGITLAFSVLVNIIMEKKLRAIDMVESLKAPE